MTNHDRFVKVFKNRGGQEFETKQIIALMRKESDITLGSIRPNDHAEGNESSCWCATTTDHIFDRDKIGLYIVR